MNDTSFRTLNAAALVAAVLAALSIASCAPHRSAPQQVQTSNPSVTYKYRSDEELIQANRRAATFCDQYQSTPQTSSFANDPDGGRVVNFECVRTSPTASQARFQPNLTYNYRTEQELLNASHSAQTYCATRGSQQTISNMVTNQDGSKTVSFQCSPG
jgi:hypothetical protein